MTGHNNSSLGKGLHADGCAGAYSLNTYRRCCPGSLKYHNAVLSRKRRHRCQCCDAHCDAQATGGISLSGIVDSRMLSFLSRIALVLAGMLLFISGTALVLAVTAVRSLLPLFVNPLLGFLIWFLIYPIFAYGSIDGVDSGGIPEGTRPDDVDNRGGMASVRVAVIALFFMLLGYFMALSSSQPTSMSERVVRATQAIDEEMGYQQEVACKKCSTRYICTMSDIVNDYAAFTCSNPNCNAIQSHCLRCNRNHVVNNQDSEKQQMRSARNFRYRHKKCRDEAQKCRDEIEARKIEAQIGSSNCCSNIEQGENNTELDKNNGVTCDALLHDDSGWANNELDEDNGQCENNIELDEDSGEDRGALQFVAFGNTEVGDEAGENGIERSIDDNGHLWDYLAFGNSSLQYFRQNQISKHAGFRGLVYRSLYERQSTCEELANPHYAMVILHLLNLVVDLAPGHKVRLVGLVAGLFGLAAYSMGNLTNAHGLSNCIDLPPCPTNNRDLSQIFGRGKSSLWHNLPHEEVSVVGDHHVAISLDSLIDHIMAHGVPLSFMQNERNERDKSGVNGCKKADRLLEKLRAIVEANGGDPNKTAFGYLIFWSDGFLTSWVKQKNNGCWCMTATIAPPSDNHRSIFHTHCIALGRKDAADHNDVIVPFFEELDKIRKGKWRYDGLQKKWIHTSFDVLVYMADRPERSEILSLLNHAGLSSKRFRYAAYTDSQTLPSCDKCFAELLKSVMNGNRLDATPIPPCNKCCNWEYSDRAAWQKSGPRKNYPTTLTEKSREVIGVPQDREVGPGSNTTYIKPHEQSLKWLTQGAAVTLEELHHGDWTKTQAGEYLKSMGVNEKCSGAIVNEGASRRESRKRKRDDEDMYSPNDNVIPAMWSMDYELDTFIDCPMHLLYLGVTKALVHTISTFMKLHKHEQGFLDIINPHLEDIGSFRLDYCLTKTLPDSLWVSENYIALARIFPWVYAHYFENFEYKGCDIVLKERYTNRVILLKQLINTYHTMISSLMARDPRYSDDVYRRRRTEVIDQQIKIFLTACSRLGTELEDPIWENRANFYCLLNLPDQIYNYGPIRDWWDGDFEFGIQQIRPDLKRIRRSMEGYFKPKLEFARKKRALKIIDAQCGEGNDINQFLDLFAPDEILPKTRFYANFHRYETIEDIQTRFNEGLPLCGFNCKGIPGAVFVAYGNGRKKINFVRIEHETRPDRILKKELCGLHFRSMKLMSEEVSFSKEDFTKVCDEYCLILPFVGDAQLKAYTIITDKWEDLDDGGSIYEPLYSTKLFSDIID